MYSYVCESHLLGTNFLLYCHCWHYICFTFFYLIKLVYGLSLD